MGVWKKSRCRRFEGILECRNCYAFVRLEVERFRASNCFDRDGRVQGYRTVRYERVPSCRCGAVRKQVRSSKPDGRHEASGRNRQASNPAPRQPAEERVSCQQARGNALGVGAEGESVALSLRWCGAGSCALCALSRLGSSGRLAGREWCGLFF